MTQMLEGLMQNDFPLTLNHIRRRLAAGNNGAEVVTLAPDGSSVTRASHAEVSARVDRLARALRTLGVEQGELTPALLATLKHAASMPNPLFCPAPHRRLLR